MFRSQIKPAILIFIIFTVITGIIYPFFVTGIAQIFFHGKANGSLIYKKGKCIGSKLIGQDFTNPAYLWGRPSATSPVPYNAASSSGSNLGPSNPALIAEVKRRIKELKEYSPSNKNPIPVDLVTSSASGLDPDISLASAYYQIPRISKMSGLPQKTIKALVEKYTYRPFLGIIGYPVVNVLKVNIALNELKNR